MSNFDPEVAPYVAFFDAIYQSLHSDGLPMSVGGMSVQEYGLIRNRLERTPQTLEEMDQARQDIEKLVRAINIAGGEGMAIPDNIKKLLEKWREEQNSSSMTQQPQDNTNPLSSNNNPPPFVTPGQGGPQTQGGLPQSVGSQVGFNNSGAASGAAGAQGTSGGESATERQLRDLLDDIGAPNDPKKSVYEALTEVIRDVVTNNPYTSDYQMLKLAEIARILATADTGYRNSDLQELTRITASPESRRAHALGNQLANLQPGEATGVTVNGQKVANVRRNPDGSYFIQALKPMVIRPPGERATPVEAFAAHDVPQGTKFTVPGFGEPIRLGPPPMEPPLVRYPTPGVEPTTINQRSYNAEAYRDPTETRPDAAAGASPSDSTTAQLPDLPTPSELDPDTFKLPEQAPQEPVPDIAAINDRWNRAAAQIEVILNSTLSPAEKAQDIGNYINTMQPGERELPARAAWRWAEKRHSDGTWSDEDWNEFRNGFSRFGFEQQNGPNGKSDDKSMGGSSSKPDLSSLIGNEKLIERLERILEVGEKAGMNSSKLHALERVLEMVSPR